MRDDIFFLYKQKVVRIQTSMPKTKFLYWCIYKTVLHELTGPVKCTNTLNHSFDIYNYFIRKSHVQRREEEYFSAMKPTYMTVQKNKATYIRVLCNNRLQIGRYYYGFQFNRIMPRDHITTFIHITQHTHIQIRDH